MAHDNGSWLDAAAAHIRAHGPTRLSTLGGAIRRRDLSPRLSALIGGDARFDIDNAQLVSLQAEQAECQTDAIWLDVVATYIREFGPATLSTLGSEIRRRPSTMRLSTLIRGDARFSMNSAQLVSLTRGESQADVDAAWLDRAAAHIAAHGPTTVSVLGGAIPRTLRATRLSVVIRGDARFRMNSAQLVSMRANRRERTVENQEPHIDIHSPAARAEMEQNKGGIVIDNPISFGGGAPCAVGQPVRTLVRITNTSSDPLELVNVTALQNGNEFVIEAPPYRIIPGRGGDLVVTVLYTPERYGANNALLAFRFSPGNFCIGRFVSASCGDSEMHEDTKADAPYEPVRPRRQRRGNVIEGVPPDSATPNAAARSMRGYDLPTQWRNEALVSRQAVLEGLRTSLQASIVGGPTLRLMQAYRSYYETLLWDEEVKLEMNMQIYNLSRVILDRRGTCLRLAVPGLAEKRPSLLRGDIVLATVAAAGNGTTYKGYIHVVEQGHVLLMFHPDFHRHHTEARPYNIEFVYPRRTLRIIHQGLQLANEDGRADFSSAILFPAQRAVTSNEGDDGLASLIRNLSLASLLFVNPSLNTEQKLAVKRIVSRFQDAANSFGSSAVAAPYVIFGPPGTGKTVTVVETALQLLKTGNNQTRLLLCAPSNTAADLLVSRLSAAGVRPTDMFRVMSYMRNKNEVSADVQNYCNYDDSFPGGYTLPPLERLLNKRVIVSTCMMAGKLYNHGFPCDYFDVVMIDEAGHCWEAEIVACFAWLLKAKTGLLVLAGDPKQLGPVTYSDAKPVSVPDPDFETIVEEADAPVERLSREGPTPEGAPVVEGLGMSMLERLLTTDALYLRNEELYVDTGNYNSAVVTKLVNCYRCHPAIIHVSNQQFYDGDLRDFSGTESHSLCEWPGLVTLKFPLIFHGIDGENEREGNSPSWFNQAEIHQVYYYVQRLLETTSISPADIGIIAPYHKQVKKIKKVLSNRDLNDITVGSCEQFQGQERKVMIISTVRTAKDLIGYDAVYNLGFVANPKRLNVAVTRAKALLIFVGSPAVLWSDVHWRSMIQHCISNGGYTGVPPPSEEEEEAAGSDGEDDDDSDDDNEDPDDGNDDGNEAPIHPRRNRRSFIQSILRSVSRAFF